MIKKTRKGQVEETFIKSILFAAVLLAVVLLLIKWNTGIFDRVNDRETCRSSILMKDMTSFDLKVGTTPQVVSIDCPRRTVVIFEDHLEVNGEKAKFWDPVKEKNVKTFELDKATINAIFADELAGCWYQYGRGEVPFLKEEQGFTVGKRSICGVCSEIRFDNSVRKKADDLNYKSYKKSLEEGQPFSLILDEDKKILGETSFLEEYDVPKKYLTDNENEKTYFSYLFNNHAICADIIKKDSKTKDGLDSEQSCNFNYLLLNEMDRTESLFSKMWGGITDALFMVVPPIAALRAIYKEETEVKTSGLNAKLNNIDYSQDYVIFMQVAATNKLLHEWGAKIDADASLGPTYFAWFAPRNELTWNTCEQFWS